MNSISKIINYIDSVTPKNIPKKKKQKLHDELLCHILEKTDYYIEIGYTEEQSIDKAIDDMGTDEDTKNHICSEFEELYHERTWWAFIPAAIILLMNYLCFPLDVWVTSADYNDDPTGWKILVSFAMLFVCFAFIRFAEIKKFRKMLVGIGVSNLLIAASLLMCFYPQAALYAVEQNFYLVLDKCTPFTLNPEYFGLFFYISMALLIIIFIYCIIQSVRIKNGKRLKRTNRGTAAWAVGCVLFSAVTTALYPVSTEFVDNYPLYFDWLVYSSEESEELFDSITIGESFNEVNAFLNGKGWFTLADCEARLERNEAKKFRIMRKERADFGSEYIVYFNPELNIDGNGFVFIKTDNSGTVTEKGVGNPQAFLPVKDENFRYYGHYDYIYDNMKKMSDDWDKMRIGDSQQEIMSRFGTEYGKVYSHLQGENTEIFAVYLHGFTDVNKDETRFVFLSFADGRLTKGDMYWTEYKGTEFELNKYSIQS